jgi:hypothetical protein
VAGPAAVADTVLAIAAAMGAPHKQALNMHSAAVGVAGVFKREGLRKPLERIMSMSWVRCNAWMADILQKTERRNNFLSFIRI